MRRIISKKVAAERADISVRTLEKKIADGTGPAIIKLSTRRVGIFEEDWEAWLLARRINSPGQNEAEAIVSRHRDARPVVTMSAQAV